MSWTIERRGRVAVVTMTTNPVNAQNQRVLRRLPRGVRPARTRSRGVPRRADRHRHAVLGRAGPGRAFPAVRRRPGRRRRRGSRDYRATNMRLFTYPRPTVAAINGHAFAGGLITAAVCDHRIAVTDEAHVRAQRGADRDPDARGLHPHARLRLGRAGRRPDLPARGDLHPRPRRTRWAWCANSSRPGTCWTGPSPSPSRHPRTASAVRFHQTRLPGRRPARHRRPRRPARHRSSRRHDERAGPARAPPLLAAAQRPPGALVSCVCVGHREGRSRAGRHGSLVEIRGVSCLSAPSGMLSARAVLSEAFTMVNASTLVCESRPAVLRSS